MEDFIVGHLRHFLHFMTPESSLTCPQGSHWSESSSLNKKYFILLKT